MYSPLLKNNEESTQLSLVEMHSEMFSREQRQIDWYRYWPKGNLLSASIFVERKNIWMQSSHDYTEQN